MVRKKKQKHNDAATTVMMDAISITSSADEQTFTALRSSLAQIKNTPGVIGYILRNTTSALIDLRNQEKLSDYAILSAQAMETADELSDLFQLDRIKYTIIEGKKQKILCLTIGENNIGIFMEKDVDHDAIIELLSTHIYS